MEFHFMQILLPTFYILTWHILFTSLFLWFMGMLGSKEYGCALLSSNKMKSTTCTKMNALLRAIVLGSRFFRFFLSIYVKRWLHFHNKSNLFMFSFSSSQFVQFSHSFISLFIHSFKQCIILLSSIQSISIASVFFKIIC